MQVHHMAAARHLMQVVHVLRDYGHVIMLLQLCDEAMALVGLGVQALLAKHVVKLRHQVRVAQPSVVGGDIRHGVILPQTIGIAESLQSTLHRHAGTGKNNNFFHCKGIFGQTFCQKYINNVQK